MNVLPLLHCLADGEYHSGQDIGRELGVSRAAIWKQMQVIKDLGVGIEAVTGRGYCIPGGLDLLNKERIISAFSELARPLSAHLEVKFSTGSTNTDALACAEAGLSQCLIIAEHQQAGRGRRGREWVSPFGHNVYMSLLWTFQSGIAALEGLSLVCAIAVRRTLQNQGVEGVRLKWPNDVYLDSRKAAGILLEVRGDISGPCQLVIGLGVNTWLPPEVAGRIEQPYSDLRSAGLAIVSRNDLAAALVNELVSALVCFEAQGFEPFREEWMGADLYVGNKVEIHAGSQVKVGDHAGVDLSGRLLLDTELGRVLVAGGEMMPGLRPASV
ncbi:biotin--[acetyl-CoA-carboxylase] ligase [Pseudohongiella spirulinae]|uniref:Bifunctional ligase/repressor BirA n=1 Tax=Pseudohongiella spirulinae TaxID=1249552 RepID=A0A0S2KFL2_9GAMM|nr:biotin--[acetyl-CoA-carboxylase] ligase [Pseudohongiella spirulinae]ALO47105.1 repressor [Pseudohongiella spirulinae]